MSDEYMSDESERESMMSGNGGTVGRRSFLKATGASACAVALAGCTDTLLGDGRGGGTPDTVTIGVLAPVEIPMGKSIDESAELAATEITENGGIDGSDVGVVTKDTKDDPGTTLDAYRSLTTSQRVDATVGIFGSENLLNVMDAIAEAETVHLTAGAATPEAPRRVKKNYDRNKYWFRVGPVNSIFLGESLVTFARDRFESMGWKKVAFLAEDYAWTDAVTSLVRNRLADEADVEVTSVERISGDTKDFTPLYDELESKNVDGVYTAIAQLGDRSLVQWSRQKRSFGYGGFHVPTQLPYFYQSANGAAIATFSHTTATPQSGITDKTVPYANAYSEEYGGFPAYSGYSAYDAVYVLKQAIENAGSVEGDDLVTELEGMEPYTGTVGRLAFYGKDEKFPHDVKYGEEFTRGVFFQWQKEGDSGVQQVIWPDEYATSEYQKPPWV